MPGVIVGGFIPSAPRYVNENIPGRPAIAGGATGFLLLIALFEIEEHRCTGLSDRIFI
jgi:hypothetical protein